MDGRVSVWVWGRTGGAPKTRVVKGVVLSIVGRDGKFRMEEVQDRKGISGNRRNVLLDVRSRYRMFPLLETKESFTVWVCDKPSLSRPGGGISPPRWGLSTEPTLVPRGYPSGRRTTGKAFP